MQTRKKLLIALCTILCTFGSVQADALTEIEKFEKCLRNAVLEFDDLTSPASDIAAIAAAQCSPSWQAVLFANNEPLTKMDGYPSNAVKEAALRSVLTIRREVAELKSSGAKREARKPNRTM